MRDAVSFALAREKQFVEASYSLAEPRLVCIKSALNLSAKCTPIQVQHVINRLPLLGDTAISRPIFIDRGKKLENALDFPFQKFVETNYMIVVSAGERCR